MSSLRYHDPPHEGAQLNPIHWKDLRYSSQPQHTAVYTSGFAEHPDIYNNSCAKTSTPQHTNRLMSLTTLTFGLCCSRNIVAQRLTSLPEACMCSPRSVLYSDFGFIRVGFLLAPHHWLSVQQRFHLSFVWSSR